MSLQKVYHNQPSISCQLLKLAADVVEAQISYVEVEALFDKLARTCISVFYQVPFTKPRAIHPIAT